MIKVTIFYPNGGGKVFDMDYYCNKHIPLVRRLLGDAVKGLTVEKGLSGTAIGSNPTYLALGNLYFDSLEAFQNSFGPNANEIMTDLPNFTNIEPIVQINAVMI